MQEQFLARLAEILDIPTADLNPAYPLDEWDSLALIATSAAIDECYDLVLPVKELRRAATVGDILRQIAEAKP